MATIQGSLVVEAAGSALFTWEAMGDADNGSAALTAGFPDKTVSVTGTFDSATVILQGSNDNSNWFTLNDVYGNALSFTAAAMAVVSENPKYIRPNTSGGSGSADIDVLISGAKY